MTLVNVEVATLRRCSSQAKLDARCSDSTLDCFLQGGVNTYSGQDCLSEVVSGGVCVKFLDYESGNGTCRDRGQFPEIYIRTL